MVKLYRKLGLGIISMMIITLSSCAVAYRVTEQDRMEHVAYKIFEIQEDVHIAKHSEFFPDFQTLFVDAPYYTLYQKDGKSWDPEDSATLGTLEKGSRILVQQIAEMTNRFSKGKTLRVFVTLTNGRLGDRTIDATHLFKTETIGRTLKLSVDETILKEI